MEVLRYEIKNQRKKVSASGVIRESVCIFDSDT